MGKQGVTAEQKAWLETHVPAFIEAQNKQETTRFITKIIELWFKEWPERDELFPDRDSTAKPLTQDELERLSTAIDVRKTQIKNWFGWHSRTQKRHGRGSGSTLAAAIESAAGTQKRTRAQKAVEVYQTLDQYKPKIRAAIKEEKARLGEAGLTRAIRLNLTKTTASKLFDLESEEVKEEVRLEMERRRDVRKNAVLPAVGDSERQPEEYQKALNEMPCVFKTVFEALANSTGWSFHILGGGPNPIAGGAIYQQDFYFGPKSLNGRTFQDAYPSYQRAVIEPFSKFMTSCFTPETMRSRALHPEMNSARPAIINQDADINMDFLDLTPDINPLIVSHAPELSTSNDHVDPLITSVTTPSATEPTSEDATSSPVAPPPPAPPTLPRASPRKEALDRFRTGQAQNADAHTRDEFDSDSDHDDDDHQGFMAGGPNSPISHAFKRMDHMTFNSAAPASDPVIAQPAILDDSLIDPVLLENLGQPPSDAATLQASTAGFIYNPQDNPFATRATDKTTFPRPPINPFTFLTSASSKTATSLPQPPITQGVNAATILPEPAAQVLATIPPSINQAPATPLSMTAAAEPPTSPPLASIASPEASPKPPQTKEPPTSTPSSDMPSPPQNQVLASMDYQVAGATISTALSSDGSPPPVNRRIKPRPIRKPKVSKSTIKPRPIRKPKVSKSTDIIGVIQGGVSNKENVAPPASHASEGQLIRGQHTGECPAAEGEASVVESEVVAEAEVNRVTAGAEADTAAAAEADTADTAAGSAEANGAAGAEANAETVGGVIMVVGSAEGSATAGEEEVVVGTKRKEPDDGLTARRTSGRSVRPPQRWEPEGRKTKRK